MNQLIIKIMLLQLLLLPTVNARELRVSVLANFGEKITKKEWQPTIDYLNKVIPQHHFILVPTTFKNLYKLKTEILNGEIDYVITNPVIYVNLELSSAISKILTLVKQKGVSQFGSVLITHPKSSIRKVDDLIGKTVAGIAKNGFGGWLIGYKEMLDSGFDAYSQAKNIDFLGTQTNILNAVLNKEVELGIIRTGVIEDAIKNKKISNDSLRIINEKHYPFFKLIVSSELYPEWAFAETKNVPHTLSKQVASALLTLPANSYEAKSANYWEWTTPYSYRSVHNLMKELSVGEYKKFSKISIDRIITTYRYEGALLALVLISTLLTLVLIIYLKNRSLASETLKNKTMANKDSLTGLYNRNYLYTKQGKWIFKGAKEFSIMFIDLDNFKNINDTFGHSYGDKILKKVARRITMLEKNSLVIRQGGDEFIILKHLSNTNDISNSSSALLNEISRPYNIDGLEFTIGCSAGIALYPKHAQSLGELLSLADIAMYKAKEHKNSFLIFDDKMKKNHLQSALIEQELRNALIKDELHMMYQPQINLDKKLYGVEALVRWNNQKLGKVQVDKFIAIAESAGLMVSIGDFIIKQSLKEIKKIQSEMNMDIHLSINISVRQLIEENFSKKISFFVKESKMKKEKITLEVTENIFIKDLDYIVPILHNLVHEGFTIALDDFGTGFSSLNILKKLPITELKIDKSFIDKVEENKDALMLKSIIEIGKNLGMRIVAEGVESLEQVKIIDQLGCDYIQGYYYSKPLTMNELKSFKVIL